MEGFYIGIAIVVAIFAFSWWAVAQGKARTGEMDTYLAKTAQSANPTFTIGDSLKSGVAGIAYDARQRKLLVATRQGDHFSSLFVDSSMILEVKIYDSGSVVAQSGGGLVGGVVGGVGIGAIGKRKNQVSGDVSLQIVLDSGEMTSWSIIFLSLEQTDAGTAAHQRRQALDEAQKWYGIVTSVAESDRRNMTLTQPAHPPLSGNGQDVSDLKELVDMHERGLLSEEEFQSAKKRLLGLG